MLTWSFKHADSSNGWATLINPHLPRWLFISSESIYKSYYIGNDSVWHLKYLKAWLPVVTAWTLFVSTLLFVMICINSILRKQWTESERLTYPIVQLPLQITSEQAFQPKGLFRNRLFWIGVVIAGAIDTVNSLNYYYPSFPTILTPGFGQSFLDIGPFFTDKPWNAIGWTPLSFYPVHGRPGHVHAARLPLLLCLLLLVLEVRAYRRRGHGLRPGSALPLHGEPGFRGVHFLLPLLRVDQPPLPGAGGRGGHWGNRPIWTIRWSRCRTARRSSASAAGWRRWSGFASYLGHDAGGSASSSS